MINEFWFYICAALEFDSEHVIDCCILKIVQTKTFNRLPVEVLHYMHWMNNYGQKKPTLILQQRIYPFNVLIITVSNLATLCHNKKNGSISLSHQ